MAGGISEVMGNAILDENLLRNLPLFSGLNDAELRAWAQCGQLVRYDAGEYLFARGDASKAFYLIQEGWVRLTPHPDSTPLATLGPGSLLGETEFFQGADHSLYAIANTPAQVWAFEQEAVQAVIDQNQTIGLKLGLALGLGIVHYRRHLLERLGRLPFLRMLENEEQRRAVVERLVPYSYQPNEVLYRSGDAPSGIYIVESGTVRIMDDMGDSTEVRQGETLGVLSALAGKSHPETAQAVTPVVVWRFGPAEFARLADTYPRLRSVLGRNLRAPLSAADRVRAVEMLKRMPLFADMERVHLDTVAACLVLRYVPAGDVLFAPGDPGDAMYFIETGQIEILSPDSDDTPHVLARLVPGDYFGEMALLTGKSRTVTARAAKHTSLWVLHRADFDALLVKLPALTAALSRALRERLSQAAETTLPTYLRRLALSGGLSRVELSALNEKLQAQPFRRGEVVCTEGHLGDVLYFIESGQVELSVATPRGRKVLQVLGEGDFFGERTLLTGQPYEATARATSDGTLWILRKSDFDTLAFRHPNLAVALSRVHEERRSNIPRRPEGAAKISSVSSERAVSSGSSAQSPETHVPSASRPAQPGPVRKSMSQPSSPHPAPADPPRRPRTQPPTPIPGLPSPQPPMTPSRVQPQERPGRVMQKPPIAPDKMRAASPPPDKTAVKAVEQPPSSQPARVKASATLSPAVSPPKVRTTTSTTKAKEVSPREPAAPTSHAAQEATSLAAQEHSAAKMTDEMSPSRPVNAPALRGTGAAEPPVVVTGLPRQTNKVEKHSRRERIATSRLGKFVGSAAVWFTTRSRRVKVGLLLLLLLFVWLCMITLPSMLIHELSANLNGENGAVQQAYARNGGEGNGSSGLLQGMPAQGVAAVLPFLETITPTPTHTPTPTDTPTVTPTPTGTLLPTWTPTPTITPTPTRTPSPTSPPATPTSRPRVRATRAPTDTPTPPPTPTPDVDYIIASVRQLTPCENEGKHHIFVHVIDQFGNGIDGVPIKICWGPSDNDCARPITETKSRGKGWVEFAMFKGTYNVRVDGAKSMVASGITPDYQLDEMCPETGNPVANSRYHASFEVIIQKVR